MHFKVRILLLEAYISKKNKKVFKKVSNEVHCKKSCFELPNFRKIKTNTVLYLYFDIARGQIVS